MIGRLLELGPAVTDTKASKGSLVTSMASTGCQKATLSKL